MQNFTRLILKRQKDEIVYLKREVRRLKRERRAYRTFYLKTMNRYCGLIRRDATDLFDFLETHRPKYSKICSDPSAIVEVNESETPTVNGHDSNRMAVPG